VTRYKWVAARKAEGFPITMAAEVAEVSRQAFHDWRAKVAAGPTEAELAEVDLVELMREIHDEFDGTYGEPRMTAELTRRGRPTNHKKVLRLMAKYGLVGVHKPAKVRTTIPAEDNPPMPDLIGRDQRCRGVLHAAVTRTEVGRPSPDRAGERSDLPLFGRRLVELVANLDGSLTA
jgi:transposase InsO family protein